MPALPFYLAANHRSGFPEARPINVLVEPSPTKPGEPQAFIARPGLVALDTVGTAPIRALFQKQGLFSNAALIVAKNAVYTLTASGGKAMIPGSPITGADLVDVDAGFDQDGDTIARVANGTALYRVTASNVVIEDFPIAGGMGCLSVQYYKGYWLGVDADTGAMFYIVPAATTWNPLQFANADYKPDKLKGIRAFGDVFAMLGEDSTEIWAATGVSSNPLAPYGGLNFDYGCRALQTAVNCRGSLLWVDDASQVRRCDGGEATVVSDNALTEQIRRVAAADLRGSFWMKDGHPIYQLTLGTAATYCLDLSNGIWTFADSQDYDFWRAHLFCNIGEGDDTVLAADAVSNQVWRLDPDVRTDGPDAFTRRFQAVLEATERPIGVGSIELHCETGGSPRIGQGSAPLVAMRKSKDGGKTFGNPRQRSLGATGDYSRKVRWNMLGTATAPDGFIFDFQISDPVVTRVSAALLNAP